MEDAAPDGVANPAADAVASVQLEGLATEAADGAAATMKEEEAEEVQEAAPAGAPSATTCGQSYDQILRSRGTRPGTVKGQ